MDGTPGVAAGQAALADGRWADARTAFEAALAERETSVAQAGLGEAAWWLCDFEASVRCRERAFVLLRREGDVSGAGRAAIDLCISYLVNLENVAAALGWLARAERLLVEEDSASLRGWLCLMRGFLAEAPEEARESFGEAIVQGRATGDVDLELVGLGDLGLSLVRAGSVADGIAMLDEAMAATLGGECRRRDTVVWTSCNMLEACSLSGDLDRARQWCRAADRFMEQFGCPFLNARCRAHYGSVLLRAGDWQAAERELLAAVELSQVAGRAPREEALARLADLRVRQGRLEDAEALLALVDDRRLTALPRATLLLATGDGAAAARGLESQLVRCGDDDVEAPLMLALLADAYLAGGDIDKAEGGLGRLRCIGGSQPLVEALRVLTAARLAAARHDVARAEELFGEAVDQLCLLDLPLETARARVELARVAARKHTELAMVEVRAAHRALQQLGARLDVEAAAAVARSVGLHLSPAKSSHDVLTVREREVLALLCRGLSNPEIARRLFISRKTAAHHVSSILAKLAVRNRAEAVAQAMTHPELTAGHGS